MEKTLEIVWSTPFEYILAGTDFVAHIVRGRLLVWARSRGPLVLRLFSLHSSLSLALEVLDLYGGIFDITTEGNYIYRKETAQEKRFLKNVVLQTAHHHLHHCHE